jgi:hypothetical protein
MGLLGRVQPKTQGSEMADDSSSDPKSAGALVIYKEGDP